MFGTYRIFVLFVLILSISLLFSGCLGIMKSKEDYYKEAKELIQQGSIEIKTGIDEMSEVLHILQSKDILKEKEIESPHFDISVGDKDINPNVKITKRKIYYLDTTFIPKCSDWCIEVASKAKKASERISTGQSKASKAVKIFWKIGSDNEAKAITRTITANNNIYWLSELGDKISKAFESLNKGDSDKYKSYLEAANQILVDWLQYDPFSISIH
ncbi:hypothetical protein DRP05_04500 [Archaeoglobales archaeon]|nr:MAG: hypothetical protein DRP05_04500 [Archaeoglobales archaeon]